MAVSKSANPNRGPQYVSKRWKCLACGRYRTTTNQRPYCAACQRVLDPVVA